MKRYIGFPARFGHGAQVLVEEETRTYPLTHHVHHSPDGFGWGYGGSGPSELARCLLWDVLGRTPEPTLYHSFKGDVLLEFDRNAEFSLDESFIWDWLQSKGVVQ